MSSHFRDHAAATREGGGAHGEAVSPDGLTVGAVAHRTGVTVRTLHHWDGIGLVAPSTRSGAGYRLYSPSDIARVHRVLIYRALGLPLERIRDVLDSDAELTASALRAQHKKLEERIGELHGMRTALERMITAVDSGITLSADEQMRIFGDTWNPEWATQARQKWGDTAQWAQYAERAASRSTHDWEEIADDVRDLEATLARALERGVRPGSIEANELAEAHRKSMSRYFDCTVSMHVCIGRRYADDPDFRAHFDTVAPGLALWLRDVIDANARANGIDPDEAIWE
ncbi:MerR family transcriptional regulator [Paramicrobacterium fandaimingii]|uniref:MerR family transcriptional regulator n=1 Tax=Paramicrobacterium fandaimingii TaxID=2708079 RepID=UPI00141FDEC4|nr:MerR family transcriptional regulator [Microbacterium fandaimingii]